MTSRRRFHRRKKTHFREVERYWVNEPYAFVIVFHSTKENERKYYAIQPHLTRIEADLKEFLTGKLRTSIKYADESIAGGDEEFRRDIIVDETRRLLARYDLYEEGTDRGIANELLDWLGGPGAVEERIGVDPTAGRLGRIADALGYRPPRESGPGLSGIAARPEPAVLAEDAETLTEYQVEKLLYYLVRDFIGYERIDPIKHDINVEDISCDGYSSPVFVYHTEYEQIISNIHHGTDELDDFVVKLAQRSGKGISKRRPQVDATLPDGSRAQLTLGREVSDHGTNYTIRQFNDVPYTPVDLVNWRTFSLDEMAFLWLCIENHKSLIFAGGTASGKTTSLNAVSLFIPSNAKIVSIEDTREVELPQRNWIASVTRPSFSDDDKGDVDEFDLLEAALRQRPDYIVMGEIRGEEGRTAFQVMSTGHTTYTTFHADSVGEVLKRFTTDPINVSKTMFTALDLVSVQSSTRVQGRKVRRNKSITEINHYDAENDEINVQDVFQWQAETDEFLRMGNSNTLEEIMFDRGWSRETLDDELQKRRVVLAYLIDRGLNTYAEVAATFQAFINDPETILALIATDKLERSLEDLRQMESVLINVDPEKEAQVPRPDPDEAGREEAKGILEEAEDLLEQYRGGTPDSVTDALLEITSAPTVEADPDGEHELLEATAREAETRDAEVMATAADAEARPDFDALPNEGIDVLEPDPIARAEDQPYLDVSRKEPDGPDDDAVSATPLDRSAPPSMGGSNDDPSKPNRAVDDGGHKDHRVGTDGFTAETDVEEPDGRTDVEEPDGRTDVEEPDGRTDVEEPDGRTDTDEPDGTEPAEEPDDRDQGSDPSIEIEGERNEKDPVDKREAGGETDADGREVDEEEQ
ncbi:flagellar protein FlaI [Halorubrum vacuolatum]|uniref:Flagellar protein FlaI n=1 Tax=Halorubrum vacuolatum TaxID=63740 RepID=A0A238WXF0_HALVU|nr:flagellar protein FlaI [Halorubrum vacuolatum]